MKFGGITKYDKLPTVELGCKTVTEEWRESSGEEEKQRRCLVFLHKILITSSRLSDNVHQQGEPDLRDLDRLIYAIRTRSSGNGNVCRVS